MEIHGRIRALEDEAGRLSGVQKILLATDGSVTRILETITGGQVRIATLVQEVVPAGREAAELLGVPEGEPVNHRVVQIEDARSSAPLIYAISDTPLSRLSPGFREDLMRADIPIGKILARHHIESRREILDARVIPAGDEHGRIFGTFRGEPLLSRRYRIIHRGEPLISIEEQFPAASFLDGQRVLVETPSRIHLGLLDMHGGIGRVDGGIGISLKEPGILLEVGRARETSARGGDEGSRETALRAAVRVLAGIRAPGGVEITLRRVYPPHTGLGSGSQIALAVARGIAELLGQDLPVRELARLTGRGGTSGIGTAAFERGGFIIDGGHAFGAGAEKEGFRPSSASEGVRPAPVIARHDFPDDWRIVLATPCLPAGASGGREAEIFRNACPVPLEEVRETCHEVLMRMLPGVADHDLDLFGRAVNRIQHLGFKRVEISLRPPEIPLLLEELRSAGAACAGMSSFGPTVYAVTDTGAPDILGAAVKFLEEHGGGEAWVSAPRNTGARARLC
ncbi:MAG TPA: beta-ribofuranosylaminobenzene 5'-phosphate synthase [Methanomicrobiales archaeon]|jgi:beta-ribofuranosylaminobenzene 5'-phosphate synthase|nr:beta-ribofuranosylaminobenzene 5'-phosphate synthase [Methanomicrobiales archaeon]